MTRSQFSPERLRRSPVFLDRHAEIGRLGGHVGQLRLDPSRLAVIEVIGLGGIGKTSLLREAKARLADKGQVNKSVWVSLGAENGSSETGPLVSLRNQLDIECMLFDTALLAYWSQQDPPRRLDHSSRLARSIVFKSVERGGGLAAGFPLPLAFALEVYDSLVRQGARYRHYSREDFQTIQDVRFDPEQLLQRLPHYLGLDIRRVLESNGGSLVAFYDGYENQSPTTVSRGAPWLRELIGTVDRGLHVVSTREPMRWKQDDWGEIVEPLPLGELPEVESRALLSGRLGALPPRVEDRLIAISKRIPFFLEALAESVEGRKDGQNAIDVGDLPESHEKVVHGLLKHLAPELRTIAVALATIQVFDRNVYEHLVRSLHLQATILDFDSFVRWLFLEELSGGVHKTHDLLTESVRSAPDQADVRQATLTAATQHLLVRCSAAGAVDSDVTLQLFRATIEGWRSMRTMPGDSMEMLIDCGYALNDAGYWNALVSLPPPVASDASTIAAVMDFFRALASRRTVGIERGRERFEALRPRMPLLGRHERSAELELAYLNELAGDYATARPLFRELSETALPFDPTNRTHVRARLYHADMLTMDGQLEKASRILLDAYETVGHHAPLTWAELVRHRGHALRFAFLFEEAARLYGQALTAARDAPAMQGKLHTNLTEACCWYDPERALEAADLSTELNLRLGNQIELAKCQAAQAIAHAKLGRDEHARAAATRAIDHARTAGYPAGEAFALQARAVCEGLGANPASVSSLERDLARLSERLGTYAHLRAVPLWLAGDRTTFKQVSAEIAWIQPADLTDRLEASIRR